MNYNVQHWKKKLLVITILVKQLTNNTRVGKKKKNITKNFLYMMIVLFIETLFHHR